MSAVVQPILKPDTTEMLAHVEHLFGGYLDGYQDGLVELAWTKTTPTDKGTYPLTNARLFKTDQLEELVNEAARLNSTPMCNVYIGAWLRKPDCAPFARTEDADAWVMTAAYADLDDEGATAKAKGLYGKVKPTWITMTGTKPHNRAQLWWKLEEPITDHDRGRTLISGLTAKLGGDHSICNPGRVMRLAGSIAWATKAGRQVEPTRRAALKEPGQSMYAAEHLEREFPSIHLVGSPSIAPKHSTNSLGLDGKLKDDREKYMRDTVAAVLIQYIGEYGAVPTVDELFDLTWPQYSANVDFSRPGRGADELLQKCRYTIRRFEEGKIHGIPDLDAAIARYNQRADARHHAGLAAPSVKAAAANIKATPFAWPASIPPREWIYGRHYIRKFVSSTVAPGGLGKSSLVIAEALAIATGVPILGTPVDERTNVWLWNGEDPQDELDRRIVATALHHKLSEKDITGRLFVDNGRQTPIVIAERTRDGVAIHAPVVEQVTETINANNIGVVIIDPFIACHRVTENDNNEIDRVAKIWAGIADRTGCAVELVHHVRKTNGNEVQVEDGRGAGALLAAARAARALNRMTKEEGERAGVENHRFYFRADDGKANLAPPSDDAHWFQMQPFDLQNEVSAPVMRPSDKIGVTVKWQWPDFLADVTAGDIEAVRHRVGIERWREDPQAAEWVGYLIIDVLGEDRNSIASVAKAKMLQRKWTEQGALKVSLEKDGYKEKKFIRPGGNR